MKALFNRLIGRTTDSTSTPALPAPSGILRIGGQLQSALKQLAVARHGDRCQTLSFQTRLGPIEWRTGQQDPFTGEWVIRKHTEESNLSGAAAAVGEPTIKTMTLHEGLDFFQAVTILSEYERGQLASTVLPLNTPDELGEKHVVAFAEREGIAFDTNGAPHPTLNGEVVTDGSFTKSALERARAFSRIESAFFKAGNNDIVSQLLSSAPRADTLFEEIMDKSETYSALKKTIKYIEDIKELTICALEKNPLKDTEAQFILNIYKRAFNNPLEYPIGEGHKINDKKAVEQIIRLLNEYDESTAGDALNKILKSMTYYAETLDQSFKNDYFSNGTRAVKLYMDLTIARHRSALDKAEQNNYANGIENIKKNIGAFESRFIELGGSEGELWRVKSTILDPNAPSIAQALKPFITQLKTLAHNLEKEIQPLKNVVHAGTASSGPS